MRCDECVWCDSESSGNTERGTGYEGEGEEGGRGVVGGGGGDGGGEGESERCEGVRGWESHLVRV